MLVAMTTVPVVSSREESVLPPTATAEAASPLGRSYDHSAEEDHESKGR